MTESFKAVAEYQKPKQSKVSRDCFMVLPPCPCDSVGPGNTRCPKYDKCADENLTCHKYLAYVGERKL